MIRRLALVLAGLAAACGGEIRDAKPSASASADGAGGGSVAILSDGGLTLVVRGATTSTSFTNGVGTVTGAGHDIRVEGGWITVDGDRRPLPPGGTITIDVATERVIVEAGGKTLAFVR